MNKIHGNSKYHKILTKEFLIKEYIKYKKSTTEIAEKIGCSQMTIIFKMIKYNIPRRTILESYKRGKNHHNYNKERHRTYYCIEPNCSNRICYTTWKFGQKRCKSCAGKGERNPTYIDGRSYEPYSRKFTSKLKLKIRKRDDFICQECGMTEEEHLIVYGRVLEVHHIDYDKENCKEENLITLCHQCNIRANFNRDYWQEEYKEKILC